MRYVFILCLLYTQSCNTLLEMEPIDQARGVTLYSPRGNYTAEDYADMLDEFFFEFVELEVTTWEHYDCVSTVAVVIPETFEETEEWCDIPNPYNYGGCMYSKPENAGLKVDSGWLLVARPDHATYDDGVRWLVRHELLHQVLWCMTGSNDRKHRHPEFYP